MEDMFFIFAGIVLGLILGSFTTALIYRHMNGQSVLYALTDKGKSAARSQCPKCGHKLEVLDLVPVLSWVWLRGKCRHCKATIPIDYPLTEIAVTFFTAFIVYHYQISVTGLGLLLILPISMTLCIVAWKGDSHSQSALIKTFLALSLLSWAGMLYSSENPLLLFKIMAFSAIAGAAAISIYAWVMTLLFSKSLSLATLICFAVYSVWVGWTNLPLYATLIILLVVIFYRSKGFKSVSRFNGFFAMAFLLYILLQPYGVL